MVPLPPCLPGKNLTFEFYRNLTECHDFAVKALVRLPKRDSARFYDVISTLGINCFKKKQKKNNWNGATERDWRRDVTVATGTRTLAPVN